MLPPRDKILIPVVIIDELLPIGRFAVGQWNSGEWISEDGTVFFTFTLQQLKGLLEQHEKSHSSHLDSESVIAFR